MKRIVPVMVLAALVLTGCPKKPDGVPRPRAFARIQLYDTATSVSPYQLPVYLRVNRSAECKLVKSSPEGYWIDIAYPAYHATIHLTISFADDSLSREKIAANRSERMALNLGDNSATRVSLVSPGNFRSTILTASGSSLTPVQLLSVGQKWIVSATATLDNLPESADSIRPIVEALRNDLLTAAKNMR
ncbi:MAG: hypothetical protein K2L46_03315 [Paramuribaculum sp.]|nr:hypothetical protein [Paramuribaculum sp.]MDE6488286.1 hypothetical protein [Paramuribaculum sp.]